jgi:[ribosomal protein S18]-alanine N-acetyltransferase
VSAPAASIELRPLAAPEIPRVAHLHVAAFGDNTEGSLARAAGSLREELHRPWALVWVAWKGEDAVGSIAIWVVADEVHVLDVATHPAHRREGIGSALVTQAIAAARSREAKSLFLEVRRSNEAAIGLYQGAGFEQTGVRKRYYPDNEDALEMKLTLSS